MSGFAFDYPENDAGLGDVMGAYTAAELPVLYGLAGNFAVSDRWFSSVPTETDANRAFSVCGTSHGIEDDISLPYFHEPTIFNGLWDDAYGQKNKTWGVYWQYRDLLDLDPTPIERVCFTVDKFTKLHRAYERGQGVADRYDHFLKRLYGQQDIPQFCYLEPFWGYGLGLPDGSDFIGLQGNDYHPPAWVGAAEYDLNVLYEALKQSRQWKNMLFIISFDEHGGTWDHEPPPAALNPDGIVGDGGFTFERLGVRVPTILVSPFVEPGTVFRAERVAVRPRSHVDHPDRAGVGGNRPRVHRLDGAASGERAHVRRRAERHELRQQARVPGTAAVRGAEHVEGRLPVRVRREPLQPRRRQSGRGNVSSRDEFLAELERRAGS